MNTVLGFKDLIKELAAPLEFDTERIKVCRSAENEECFDISLDGMLWSELLMPHEMETTIRCLFKGMRMTKPLMVGDIVESAYSHSRAVITCIEKDKISNEINYYIMFGDGSTDRICDENELCRTDEHIDLKNLTTVLNEVKGEKR